MNNKITDNKYSLTIENISQKDKRYFYVAISYTGITVKTKR